MILHHALFATVMLLLLGEGHCGDPCLTMVCSAGQFCVSKVPPCLKPPCARVGLCVSSFSPANCPSLVCPQPSCPPDQVRKFDSAGCKTCDCYDPCKGVECPPDQECVVRANDSCIHAVCIEIDPTPPITTTPADKETDPTTPSTPSTTTEEIVPASLWCYGWTEPHYDTFDGAGIDFQGVGTYVMSQYANNNLRKCRGLRDFQVLVLQENRGSSDVSYIDMVTLVLPGIVTIALDGRLTGPGGGAVDYVVSGAIPKGMKIRRRKYLPFSSSSFRWNGAWDIRIETSFGLVVQYDGDMSAGVGIPAAYRNCVVGLCGDADGNPANDYSTSSGFNVIGQPTNMRFWSLGNSWRVVEPAVKLNEDPGDAMLFRSARGVVGDDVGSAVAAPYELAALTGQEQTVDRRNMSCTVNMLETVDKFCGVLIDEDGPLGECIQRMPERAKAIYNGCKYDVCANWDDMALAESLAQSSINTFVAICAGNGLLTQTKEV